MNIALQRNYNVTMSVVINDAALNDIVRKKILILRMSKANLKHQQAYAEIAMRFQQHMARIAQDKLQLVEELLPLYEMLLTKYDSVVEQQCHELCDEINACDMPADTLREYTKPLDEHQSSMLQLQQHIIQLEKTIPSQAEFKQWRIKVKETLASSCAAQASQI